eukprot:3593691-Lingulodinium_polyedra.AAC.1
MAVTGCFLSTRLAVASCTRVVHHCGALQSSPTSACSAMMARCSSRRAMRRWSSPMSTFMLTA